MTMFVCGAKLRNLNHLVGKNRVVNHSQSSFNAYSGSDLFTLVFPQKLKVYRFPVAIKHNLC